nr:replication-relaxation family protein [Lentzea cavernae]
MLHEHRVFTSQQIVELCYPSKRAANHRLLDLFRWRFVDRFQPFVSTGAAPMHYVLDIAGAVALAYEDGLDPKRLGYRHEDAMGIAHSLRLAHTVGVNGFFTSLVARSQRSASGQLTTWWSELRCTRLFGDMVRPDAYGRWCEDDTEIEFFLEFDFGTEDLGKLGSKLYGYEKLATATGISTPVLVWLPTSRRETNARKALSDVLNQLNHPTLLPVATSAADRPGENDPATARWLPISATEPRRVRLSELARRWPRTAVQPSSTEFPPRQVTADIAAPNPLPPPASPFGR